MSTELRINILLRQVVIANEDVSKADCVLNFFVFLSGKGFSLDLLAVFSYAVISIAYFVAL